MSHREKLLKTRLDAATKCNKRLRKETRFTPWKDEWELQSVGQGLLSVLHPPSTAVESALDTVNVWKARSHALEALPHAIESTSALAQVYWRDQVQGGSSVSELRLAYSSAVIRCINGFSDALQQQRFVAAPVSVLCGQLGIPSWLVDVRHEASHNALPTLSVLRLAVVSLLEYLSSEYWIPTCPNWSTLGEQESKVPFPAPIETLMQYKTCAAAAPSSFQVGDDRTKSSPEMVGGTDSSVKPSASKITSKPFDTFFGDNDDDESSDDEEDWEDPLLGRLWGPSVGTNANRFAVLEPPKKVKPLPKKKKAKRPKIPPSTKKALGEKYPIDFAKEFVEQTSPQQGYYFAIRFLVWGGVGGTPEGRGVLIPGSVNAFPATMKGIRKSWERYMPLLEVLGRIWPGFLASLLIHLVDLVLSIEAGCAKEKEQDAGSARKLFFLSSWIRLLVSEDFAQKVYPASKLQGKKVGTAEIPLASMDHLEPFHYPLNSLCDRCSSVDRLQDFQKTSMDILQTFEAILGERRVPHQGLDFCEGERPASSQGNGGTGETASNTSINELAHGPALGDGKMSLDEIESLLSDGENSNVDDSAVAAVMVTVDSSATIKRPAAWGRCKAWDACSIGSLPGYPV